MVARFVGLLVVVLFAAAPKCGAAEDGKAGVAKADERITLFDLVTAAPLPAGYSAKRQDFEPAAGQGNTLIFLTTAADKSRVQVTIEKQQLFTKEQKVAAFKTYVNGIHGLFTKRGYRTLEIETPDTTTLDPDKRLDLRMKMQKEANTLYVDAEIFFTDHGFVAWSVAHDEKQRELLKAWIGTVRAK